MQSVLLGCHSGFQRVLLIDLSFFGGLVFIGTLNTRADGADGVYTNTAGTVSCIGIF